MTRNLGSYKKKLRTFVMNFTPDSKPRFAPYASRSVSLENRRNLPAINLLILGETTWQGGLNLIPPLLLINPPTFTSSFTSSSSFSSPPPPPPPSLLSFHFL